jgi:hypothetical protein
MGEIAVDASAALERAGRGDAAILLASTGRFISQVLYGGEQVTGSDVKRITEDVSNVIAAVNSLSKVARGR